MFPRIKKSVKKSGTYEYLVLSESVRDRNGRSTTKDVSNLGNIARFDKSTIRDLIDGLIRLFEIEEYGLTDLSPSSMDELNERFAQDESLASLYTWNKSRRAKDREGCSAECR